MNVILASRNLILVAVTSAHLVLLGGQLTVAQELPPAAGGKSHFEVSVAPFLEKHCVACHSGDDAEAEVAFDRYSASANVQT
ncbi:MAG: hypothetical protein ABGZ24_07210, partial [Fuerstiella sp.]